MLIIFYVLSGLGRLLSACKLNEVAFCIRGGQIFVGKVFAMTLP